MGGTPGPGCTYRPGHVHFDLPKDWQRPVPEAIAVPFADAVSRLEELVTLLEGWHSGTVPFASLPVAPGLAAQVTGLSCKVVPGTRPSICPDAEPLLPHPLLPRLEEIIRGACRLTPGTTVHWVGQDAALRARCRCHPNAPSAAPCDQDRRTATDPASPPDPVGLLSDPSKCPECRTPPNPLDLAAGGTAWCRGCGMWGLDTSVCLLPSGVIHGDSTTPQRLHTPCWRRASPDRLPRTAAGDVNGTVGREAGASPAYADLPKQTGRPHEKRKQVIVKYVRGLRAEGIVRKQIPEAVLRQFRVKYTAETLRGYLKGG
jgi:hypothetical protein